MSPSRFPEGLDTNKLAEVTLAILSLPLNGDGRVWKSLDWDLMDLLEEKGWIVSARSEAKSVVLTDEGEELAKNLGSSGRRRSWPASTTPGFAQIHGLEEQDVTKGLVLELVEGPTLADRIAQGPIPVDEALPIAKQIAEALEAAYEMHYRG